MLGKPGSLKAIPFSRLVLKREFSVNIPFEPQLPDHLTQLTEYLWAYWRTILLRSAGFPADDILRLADDECREAADSWIDADGRAREAFEQCHAEIAGAIEVLLQQKRTAVREWLRVLRKLRKGVATGRVPAASEDLLASYPDDALWRAVGLCREHLSESEHAKQKFEEEFDRALCRQSERIFELARGERFREATLWQSRSGYDTGIVKLLTTPPEGRPSSSRRKREELVASYLQRYCVKNDTIGYFGPAAWVDLEESGPVVEVTPGPELIARCQTFLEDWCFDELAKTLAKDPEVRPWLKPRGDSVLMEEDNRLIIRAQGGRTVLDPFTFVGDFLMFHLSNYFDLLGRGITGHGLLSTDWWCTGNHGFSR